MGSIDCGSGGGEKEDGIKDGVEFIYAEFEYAVDVFDGDNEEDDDDDDDDGSVSVGSGGEGGAGRPVGKKLGEGDWTGIEAGKFEGGGAM